MRWVGEALRPVASPATLHSRGHDGFAGRLSHQRGEFFDITRPLARRARSGGARFPRRRYIFLGEIASSSISVAPLPVVSVICFSKRPVSNVKFAVPVCPSTRMLFLLFLGTRVL